MSHSVVDTSYLPSLNTLNIRGLGSSGSSKQDLLRSYVQSQTACLASYASEGRAVMASWKEEHPSYSAEVQQKPSLNNFEIESGFGTPVLKPRARGNQTASEAAKPDLKKRHEHSADKGTKVHTQEIHQVNADCRGSDVLSERDNLRVRHSRGEKHTKHICAIDAKGEEAKEAHRARLVARNERRQAKRAIVDPKMRPTGSMSDTDVEEEPTQVNKASKSKKAKGLNMPAGLALMHGFSATNVGKNRLTIRNVPHTGVFSKGKASVKTAVKKGKHARSTPASNVFSEERFLSKSGGEARTFSDNEVSDDEQGKATEGRLSVFEEDLATRKRSCQNDSVQRKRTRSENISSRPKKRARAERMASPIWDIELASGGLPSDSSDQHQPIATEVTRASGTIIVDTRRDGVKWAAVEPAVANLEPGADADSKSSQDVPTNASSLAPSQSASQAALRCHDMSSETPAAILSKYFTEPTLAAPRVEAAKLQDTPFTAPVEPTSNPPRVTMGQLTGGRGAHPGYGSSSDQCLPFTTPTPASTASLPSSFSRVDRGYVPDRPVSPRILDHDSASLHTDSQLSWLAGPPSPALSHAPALAHSDILGHSLLIGDVPPSGRSSSKHKSAPFRQHGRRRVDLSRRPYSPASPSHADLPKTEARRTRPISETDSYMDLVFSDSVVAEQHAEPFTYPGFSAHSASYDGVTDRPGDPRSFTAMSNLSSDSLGFDDIFLADYQNAPALTYLGEMDGTPVDQNGCECGSSDLIYPSRWRQQNTHDTTALHAWHYVGIGEDFPVSSPHISEVADTAEVPSFDISDADRSSGYLAWRRPFDDDAGVISDFERDVVDTTTGFDGGATIMEVEPVEFEVDDPVSESELECSVLDSLQRFSQGRALLCGILDVGAAPVNSSSGAELAKAEVDVVRSLKGHWQPQRF